MTYRQFKEAVNESGLTVAMLRCDVPPNASLLAFMDEVGEAYEEYVQRLTLCPGCGKTNQYALDEGYTDEFPREWHAECAHKAAESGNDPRDS